MRNTAAAALLLLSGCAVINPEPMDFPVRPEELAPYLVAGGGVVKGEAFLKQRGGTVVTCAGNEVYLLPATSYFVQRLAAVRQRGEVLPVTDETAKKAKKTGKCNSRGEFEFSDLAPGRWLVITTVTWDAGGAGQGGIVSSPVDVTNGKPASLIITE